MVWPKLTVSDYPEMLRKLSATLFLVTLGCLSLLRAQIPSVDDFFSRFDVSREITLVGSIHVSLGTVVIAFIVAAISESVKLHDKISGLLGIRAGFDVYRILIPLALLSSATVGDSRYGKIMTDRNRLMREVFYAYASSAKDTKIDKHLVIQALTAWSWYWFCVESITIIAAAAVVLARFGQWTTATLMLALILVLQLLARIFQAEANKYAEAEVSQIVADAARREAVKSVFDAL